MTLWLKLKVSQSIGIKNVISVLVYRTKIKLGYYKLFSQKNNLLNEDFFYKKNSLYDRNTLLRKRKDWVKYRLYFGWMKFYKTSIPNWHENPINSIKNYETNKNWSQINDFNPKIGDIKLIWEASRFDWVISFSQNSALGDKNSLIKLNYWLNDWERKNPYYFGPNWKCGQEASIRIIKLSIASIFLEQVNETSIRLLKFVENHLKRIELTVSYAIAQDNNHGTSEAAALFIGGIWLEKNNIKKGLFWKEKGRKILENRAQKLILSDGTFSQYSTNYHRFLIDTFSIVEIWRRKLNEKPFSKLMLNRVSLAIIWLRSFIQDKNGDVPNLGPNDGSRLFFLEDSDYRDYRYSVQLAANIFLSRTFYNQTYSKYIFWFKLKNYSRCNKKLVSKTLENGGFHIFRGNQTFGVLRSPEFLFRPKHADALHFDLWLKGENILIDDGTYSYFSLDSENKDLGTVKSHNSIQFDNHDQMPKLSRFLYGNWLKNLNKKKIKKYSNKISGSSVYADYSGCKHNRKVIFSEKKNSGNGHYFWV